MGTESLWKLGMESIAALETERGVLASGRDEVYGCVFGRDSLITGLKLLRVYETTRDPYFLRIVQKILCSMCELQGKELNIESGEEPGKIIHEYRPEGHERLTDPNYPRDPDDRAWYLYPDDVLRNYDSVDATPLFLMLFHEYFRLTKDESFIDENFEHIRAAAEWLLTYGDTNGDGLLDYRFHEDRTMGGLKTQSWMDSTESVFFETVEERPSYPIAPVEVQAYAWAAMRSWGDALAGRDASLAERLLERADALKRKFNERFVLERAGSVSLAFALDGCGRLLKSPRSSMGHVLWAAYRGAEEPETILEGQHVEPLVRRLMRPDLFARNGGIRTLSSRSTRFEPVSYHNGSIWPHDTAMLAEGLEDLGFIEEATQVRRALLRAYTHFKTPIELFGYSRGKFCEYETSQGGKACRVQAWSAASLLSTLRKVELDVVH